MCVVVDFLTVGFPSSVFFCCCLVFSTPNSSDFMTFVQCCILPFVFSSLSVRFFIAFPPCNVLIIIVVLFRVLVCVCVCVCVCVPHKITLPLCAVPLCPGREERSFTPDPSFYQAGGIVTVFWVLCDFCCPSFISKLPIWATRKPLLERRGGPGHAGMLKVCCVLHVLFPFQQSGLAQEMMHLVCCVATTTTTNTCSTNVFPGNAP